MIRIKALFPPSSLETPTTVLSPLFTVRVAESIISCNGVDEADLIKRIASSPIKGYPGWEQVAALNASGEYDTRVGSGAAMRVSPVGI